MSKSILVIDTPKSCNYCPLCIEDYYSRDYCVATDSRIWYNEIPEWCPLREFPQRRKMNINTELPSCAVEITQEEFDHIEKNPNIIYFIKENVSDEYASGYNACIDEILGG